MNLLVDFSIFKYNFLVILHSCSFSKFCDTFMIISSSFIKKNISSISKLKNGLKLVFPENEDDFDDNFFNTFSSFLLYCFPFGEIVLGL